MDERTGRQRYEQVCGKLNLDEQSMDAAWDSYKAINNDFGLDGNHLEWLGCALYVACQNSTFETVEGEQSSGNKVSLTQILKATGLNLIEFFKKIKNWLEMARLDESFHTRVIALERKFEVASIIFDKYRKVFCDLFSLAEDRMVPEHHRRGRGRKTKSRPCSPLEVFRFGWVLYIYVKSQYPQINDDLVNSHHLLLCCLDMLWTSALQAKRRDLLRPECPFLPADFVSADFSPSPEMPCILPELCNKYKAIEKECHVIRDYHWRGRIKKLFEMEVLKCNPIVTEAGTLDEGLNEALPLLLAPANFHNNDKALNRVYEEKMLAEGDFDERVFLHPNASEEIGTPTRGMATSRMVPHQTPPQHIQYGTPLLGREHLTSKDTKLTPVSDATNSVTQLHMLLVDRQSEPSDYLKKICSSCMSDPLPELEQRVQKLSEKFLEHSPNLSQEDQPSPSSFAQLRLHLSVSLYYKLLEAIIRDEEKKKAGDFPQLQTMLEYRLFHQSLFALCVETVLFSYNSQSRVFPWVLEVFDISAYHFYKLIEVAIKVEPHFSRGIIKHLNWVEEVILGQLAWRSDSPLFDAIEAAGSIPSYEEVALPVSPGGLSRGSPPQHPRLKSLGGRGESPLSSLLSSRDRVTSPNSSARRQLFSPGGQRRIPTIYAPTKPIPIAPKPQQGGGGGVTVTPIKLLTTALQLQYLHQQQTQISQQLQTTQDPRTTPTNPVSNTSQATSEANTQPLVNQSLTQQVSTPTKPVFVLTASSPMSMASAGTQTSPVRSLAPANFQSPTKPISIASIAEIMSPGGTTSVSPSKITATTLLSPGAARQLGGGATIPLSPPIPSVTVTPSPAKTPHRGSLSATPTAAAQATPQATPPAPKRTGSLALFYRKVYQLAYIRIRDLCDRLQLGQDTMQKVWTCFEHSMVKSADILRDRHLDQMIMCCIYVLAKVLRLDITFQEIMRQYRHQPQAKSHVYRHVLLNNGPRKKPQPDTRSPALGTPMKERETDQSEASVAEPGTKGESPVDHILYRADIPVNTHGDIIQFYNKLFIGYIKDYALKFSPNDAEGGIPGPSLSPLPVIRKTTPSPLKVSKNLPIFVSPHKAGNSIIQLSPLAKTYVIQKSPATKLEEINEALRSEPSRAGAKRQLDLRSSSQAVSPAKRPALCKAPTLMRHLKSMETERASVRSHSSTEQGRIEGPL